MPDSVLAILTAPGLGDPPAGEPFRFADPAEPVLSVLDLGATRGDGVFETLGVAGGRAQAVDAHLARLARSAAMLELPEPDRDAWSAVVFAVAERFADHAEAFVKLVYTRGVEGTGRPTGWALGAPAPDHTPARTRGIGVAVLDRGTPHDVSGASPWLLQGAKSLSYAVNMAALREARSRGADDVVFVSTDGYLLEGPTSNLLLLRGDRLLTPSTSLGILAGTTQADAFRFARGRGLTTSYEVLPRSALDDADAAWLLSSVRYASPIRAVDGVERPVDAEFSAALNAFLLARRGLMADAERAILDRLARGEATLAQLRSAFPPNDAHARALPSMGEEDPFGIVLTALVNDGRVLDEDGRYRLAPSDL